MATLMHRQLLASVIETIANQALSMSPASRAAIADADGATLLISLTDLSFACQIMVTENKLMVTTPLSADEPDADCKLTSSLSTLRELSRDMQLTDLIKQDKLDIQGDLKVAQKFAAIADSIDIDWPSELEKHIGDIATYRLMSLGSKIKSKAQFVKTQIESDASEYLIHEKKLVVTNSELRHFINGVTACDKQLSLLDQRIAKLYQHFSQSS
ncbi:SCP2 domain-containing protein [Thalassotalea euphylliae]|uniref:ubiquinone biosynthesis accessory factor UbiJ n=1 Tax=Thalassotalea euphylliae TaxID=1655234 RepID=UPI003637711B